MFQLIILVIASIVIAYSTRICLDKLIPVVMMASVIITYSFALFLNLNTSVYITCFLLAAFAVSFFVSGQKKYAGERTLSYVFTPQIIVAVIVCMLTFICFKGHQVIHWDDLNVWAIYPKTLFHLNRLPLGIENCSVTYKDYQPLQQIMQCFFIYGMKSFSEERLFQINACFMYVLLLPVLGCLDTEKKLSLKNSAVVALYVVFPHVFTTQFYSKLGVDYLISILFGLGIYYIYQLSYVNYIPEKQESQNLQRQQDNQNLVLLYVSLVTVMTYLALIKSSGIILVLFLLILMFLMLYEKGGNKLKYMIMTAIPVLYYFSWKIFAKKTGNTGYMSETIDSNIKDFIRSIIHNVPSYTVEVLLHYIKNVFAYVLTREKFGITAVMIIAIIAVIFYLCKGTLQKKALWAICIGFALFCAGHLYMYLFVFDEWEAHGLMEYDRYICQYLAGVLLFAIILLLKSDAKDYITYAILALFIVVFPYHAAAEYLIPSNFEALFDGEYREIKETGIKELTDSKFKESGIPNDEDSKIVLVTNAWDDAIMFFTYEAVPKVIEGYANIPAIEAGTLYNTLRWRVDYGNDRYAYVCNNAKESYPGDFDTESSALTDDGQPLKPGFYEIVGDRQFHRIDIK